VDVAQRAADHEVTAVINGAKGGAMGMSGVLRCLALVLSLASAGAATAQGAAATAAGATAPASAEKVNVDVLKGTWVRPDGGYTIVVRSIGPGGQLEATYFNPNPLPFAKAEALPDGAILRVHFELQAGGYAGSTYALDYDPASDRLRGTYYQAVARQKYEVYFVRK